jgi:hypothetical protein
VERRKKFNMMIADSSTEKMAEADCDPTGKSQSRVLFYKAVVRLVSNIQAMHSNNLAEPDGRLKLFALPEPIPNYIRPRLAKLMRTHHFLPTDHDMKLIAMGDSVPAVAAKKVKPPKLASLSASGGGGYGGGYGAGVGVGAGGGVAAAGHHSSHGYSETSHRTQKPRHLRQCYTEEDLYAQTYKKQRSAPAPQSSQWRMTGLHLRPPQQANRPHDVPPVEDDPVEQAQQIHRPVVVGKMRPCVHPPTRFTFRTNARCYRWAAYIPISAPAR